MSIPTTSISPAGASGLRDALIRSKGAVPISHEAVIERIEQLSRDPGSLSIAAPANQVEAEAHKALAEIRGNTDRHAPGMTKTAAATGRKRRAKVTAPREVQTLMFEDELPPVVQVNGSRAEHEPQQATPVRPSVDLTFIIDGVGEFESEAASVLIDDEVISVWEDGDSTVNKTRFRARRGLELDLRYDDLTYRIWSPGVHIYNPDQNCTVSVYLRK